MQEAECEPQECHAQWHGRVVEEPGPAGRHVHLKRRRLTPPPQEATRTLRTKKAGTHTRCHVAAQAAALRHSLFAGITLLRRETAFAEAGRCLERGQRQHAGGCLVSTRSRRCALARVATSQHALARERGCCHVAAQHRGRRSAQPNPPRACRWTGILPPRRCHGAAQQAAGWRVGLSGRLPKSPPRSVRGSGSSGPLPRRSTAAPPPLPRRSAAVALLPKMSRPGHLQQLSHAERGRDARSAAATVAVFAVLRPQPEGRLQALRGPRYLSNAGRAARQ